jgi:LAO/AO transport system kinase
VPELVAAIMDAGGRIEAEGTLARRRRRARYLIARAAADLIAARVKEGGPEVLDALADKVLAGDLAPEAAAKQLLGNETLP